MNKLDRRLVLWSKGGILETLPAIKGVVCTKTHVFFDGRPIALRTRSPVSRSTIIWVRETWQDGGKIDSPLVPAIHFGTKWTGVPSDVFSSICNAYSAFMQARSHKKPTQLSPQVIRNVGVYCRKLMTLHNDTHAILGEPDEVVGVFCLEKVRHKKLGEAICVIDVQGGWPESTTRKAQTFKRLDDAVLHKMCHKGGAVYRL